MPRSALIPLLVLCAALVRGGEADAGAPPADSAPPTLVGPSPVQPLLVDAIIRYVNEDSITGNDVITRAQDRWADNRRRGLPIPQSRRETEAFLAEALDELTDEALLLQKAKSLNIQLDRDRISAEVLAIAKREGGGMTLRDQAMARRDLERARTIQIVLDFFEARAAQATPAELRAEYERQRGRFRRPPQAKAMQIVLAIASEAELKEQRAAQAALLKQAQRATDPAIRAAADACLATFLDAQPDEQQRLLDALTAAIAGRHGAKDLPAADQPLVAEARSLAARAAGQRTAAQAAAELSAVRDRLAAGGDLAAAFQEEARRLSQGQGAAAGGDLGTVEPGTYAPAIDAAIFTGPVGAVAGPITVGNRCLLLLVTDRQPGRDLSFDEVVADLELGQSRLRRGLVRQAVVEALRAKAAIRPGLLAIPQLVR